MKKFFAVILSVALMSVNAFAYSAGMPVQPTDIRVVMHGKEIPSCCVNNSMYIAAEDLAFYGYSVTYVDSVRTLFVNKTGTPEEAVPELSRVDTPVETDIRVFVNGSEVDKNSVFAMGGKMYVNANAIGRYRDGNNNSDPGNPGHPHMLKNTWDGENRILYVDDAPLTTKEEQKAVWLSFGGKRDEYTFLSFNETEYKGEGFEIIRLTVGGLPHGASNEWYYFGDDGKVFSINALCNPYKMYNGWGISSINNARIEGRKMYFDAMRTLSREPKVITVSGSYCLDLDTTVVSIIEEK